MLRGWRARASWSLGATLMGFPPPRASAHRPNPTAALRQFRRAVQLDDAMADAWLGVHAAAEEGVEQYEDVERLRDAALDRMVEHVDRFGEQRAACAQPLVSSFKAGWWFAHPLDTADHLWHAFAMRFLTDGINDRAAAAAERVTDPTRQHFLFGAVAAACDSPRLADAHFSRIDIENGGQLGRETCLRRGICRFQAADLAGAEVLLRAAAEQRANPLIGLDARYYLGLLYREMGDEGRAVETLSALYAEAPDHRQVGTAATNPGYRLAIFEIDKLDGLGSLRVPRSPVGASFERIAPDPDAAEPIPPDPPVAREGAELAGSAEPQPRRSVGAAEPPTPSVPSGEPDWDAVAGVLAELDAVVGLDAVRDQIADIAAEVRRGFDDPSAPRTAPRRLLFSGPAGTGKPTTARAVGRLYHALGLVDQPDLAGSVTDRPDAPEPEQWVIGTGDRSVTVTSGTAAMIDDLITADPALTGATRIEFTSLTPAELTGLAARIAQFLGETLTPQAAAALARQFADVCADCRIDALGNAQYVRALLTAAVEHRDADSQPNTLTAADVEAAVVTVG